MRIHMVSKSPTPKRYPAILMAIWCPYRFRYGHHIAARSKGHAETKKREKKRIEAGRALVGVDPRSSRALTAFGVLRRCALPLYFV